MSRLNWGAVGERFYETGVDRGVLYVTGQPGVPWNGLTSVLEAPTGGEATPFYIDGVKYLNVASAEEFEATITAFTYPDEFYLCEGSVSAFNGLFVTHQPKRTFGMSYRSKIGNDVEGPDHGYKLHIIYNALAEPSQRSNTTINGSSAPSDFSWKVTTCPPVVPGYKRTAHFFIDSRFTDPVSLSAIEDVLYGSDSNSAHLPTPLELFNIFETSSSFVVVDNGDGSFTATGTDFEVHMLDATSFEINTSSAEFVDEDSYTLSSP